MAFELSGASQFEIRATAVSNAKVDLSGASGLTGQLKANGKADFSASGAGRCALSGSAGGDGVVDGSGAGSFDLANFTLPNASVKLSGASDATVNTSGKLNVGLSGGSRLNYLGTPSINTINISGGSSIEKG